MDKICIVKLRQRMGQAIETGEPFRNLGSDDERAMETPVLVPPRTGACGGDEARQHREDKFVESTKTAAFTLTRDQMRRLTSNPHLMSLLNGKFSGGIETVEHHDDAFVVQFQFASMIPLRLLKSSDVVQMLRISKYLLRKIVREGNLKSYKIGRLRRFLLDDILSYLQENCEVADLPCNSRNETSVRGF
jgi:excisionase family DNA binding protein